VSTEEERAGAGTVDRKEAERAVAITASRLALLHLCYAQTLVEELGEKWGRELAARAIKRYGQEIGRDVQRAVVAAGLEPEPSNYGRGDAADLPGFGMHERIETFEEDGQARVRAYGCTLAKLWRQKGGDDLGRIYCLVDPAKYMAYNPGYRMVHLKCVPDGDAFCEFAVVPTSAAERELFEKDDPGWTVIDKP